VSEPASTAETSLPSQATAAALVEGLPAPRDAIHRALRRLTHDPVVLVGAAILVVLGVAAAAAPLLAPYRPDTPHFADALRGPGSSFLFGTDNLGRDELSRLLWGARVSLGSVVLASVAIMAVGVAVGLVSGYYGGAVDNFIQRIVDVLLAFPSLVLALAIAGVLGPSLRSVVIAVVAVGWVSYARLVRGMVLAIRARQFVEAARSLGASNRWIIVREILPNVVPPVIVLVTLEMGGVLLTISSLSFLGLGSQPPAAEWGTMLNEARPFFESNPHLMIAPGLAIAATVLAFNLVGDGLRDALDPHAQLAVDRARWRRRFVRRRLLDERGVERVADG
jgi:peptide/nickel transport system permease protein